MRYEQRQFNRLALLVVWVAEFLREGIAWAVYSGVSAGINRSFGGSPSYSPRCRTPEEMATLMKCVPGYDDRPDEEL